MKTILAAVGMWTLFVMWVLLFNPGGDAYWSAAPGVLGCLRLIEHSAECEAALAAANAEWEGLHIIPVQLTILSGYLAIAIVATIGALRRRTRPRP